MSAHAQFSPSASERWIKCPKSVALTAELAASGSEHSIYSASGTTIHAIGEDALHSALVTETDPNYNGFIGMTWGAMTDVGDFNDHRIDEEMVQQAKDYVRHALSLHRRHDMIGIETKLRYSNKLFGTADLVLHNHERAAIIDLKTGAGNLVSPEDNLQLLTYAGIWMNSAKVIPPEIHLTIIQPPDDIQCKTWVTTPARVEQHMDDVRWAMKNPDVIKAGKHCRWCPVRASCPELHAIATNAKTLDLDGLTPDGWADALEMAEILKTWSASVFDRANQLVSEEGLTIPGYKLVEKQGRKGWASEKEAAYHLSEILPVDAPNIFNDAKLRTPTQLARELKDYVSKDEIDALTSVPVRGTILVHSDDKREPVETGVNLLDAADQLALFN